MTLLAEKWKACPQEKRKPFEELAKEDKERYFREKREEEERQVEAGTQRRAVVREMTAEDILDVAYEESLIWKDVCRKGGMDEGKEGFLLTLFFFFFFYRIVIEWM